MVTIAAEVWEVMGYLEETICNINTTTRTTKLQTTIPTSTLSDISILFPNTPWDLNQLLAEEWRAKNVWAKDLLHYNIYNFIRLSTNVAGTAVDLWKLLYNILLQLKT